MEFDDWMRDEGLSESSVLKYYSAIKGSLSDWASDADIISGSILDITNADEFLSIILQIKKLSVFQERNRIGHHMYGSALNKYSEFLTQGLEFDIETDIQEIIANRDLDITEKAQLVSARIGQGQYRKALVKLWNGCSVTRYSDTSMLVASHIKPWSRSTNHERLDKFNGLLLLPNLDKAFDKGLISFDVSSGHILISSLLGGYGELGINDKMFITLSEEQKKYMQYHSKYVFKGRAG